MFKDLEKIIEDFFNSHLQVNDVGVGSSANISMKNVKFPAIWIEPTNSYLSNYTTTYGFNIYSYTLYQQSKENLIESINDTNLILLDLVSYLKLYDNDNIYIDLNSISIDVYDAKYDDFANGWVMKFEINVDSNYEVCNLPINNLKIDNIEQLTTSTAYTYYDISVSATGGLEPYSGTGTFSKTYGTYTFTVTDANGDSVSEDFTVNATIPEAYYQMYATGYDTDDGYYLSPTGFNLYIGTYYINWGDGTDEIIVMPANTTINSYFKHKYDEPGFKSLDIIRLDPTSLEEIQNQTLRLYGGTMDLRYFKNRTKPLVYQSDLYQVDVGDIANFKIDKPAVKTSIAITAYGNYQTYIYGDIINFKYYKFTSFLSAAETNIYGDFAELINQDDDEINLGFNIRNAPFTCSAIDPTYTNDKSVQHFYLVNTILSDETLTNILLQISQNQIYIGGTINIFNIVTGKIDLTDPVVLAAYDNLLALGWSLTIPTY